MAKKCIICGPVQIKVSTACVATCTSFPHSKFLLETVGKQVLKLYRKPTIDRAADLKLRIF